MNSDDLLWEILTVTFVTSIVVIITLFYQKKFRDNDSEV